VIVGLDARLGGEVVEEARSLGADALFVAADVSEEEDAARMVASALEQYGRLDIACNAAGVSSIVADAKATAVATMDRSLWQRTLDVNLTGTWLSMKYELRPMLEAGCGAIVNVSSTAAMHGVANTTAYSASKAGVNALTRGAAREVAASGVRVNAVVLGTFETPMLEDVFEHQPERRAAYASATPLGRIADPSEAAAAIVFLCSPAASYVTGALVAVDGGITA
jgi:NAD(P)-dependent dehydrogenase (short-subunit alcohol dehydrogenase family)